MFTVNNKDTITTPLTSLILIIVYILSIEQLSRLKLLTLNRYFLGGTTDITNKNSQNKIFPFNFAFTKICVAIRLEEGGTRMGGI